MSVASNQGAGTPLLAPSLLLSSGEHTLVGVPNSTLYIQNLNERARLKGT